MISEPAAEAEESLEINPGLRLAAGSQWRPTKQRVSDNHATRRSSSIPTVVADQGVADAKNAAVYASVIVKMSPKLDGTLETLLQFPATPSCT